MNPLRLALVGVPVAARRLGLWPGESGRDGAAGAPLPGPPGACAPPVPAGQHGKQLPGLGLTALQHRQVVGIGVEWCQELIEFPLEPVAGLLDGQAQGIRAMAADQAIGITAAGKLHHRQLQA